MSYKDKEILTGKEFRELLQISPSTLNRWIKSGKIKAVRLNDTPRSPVRIPSSEVDRIMQTEPAPTAEPEQKKRKK